MYYWQDNKAYFKDNDDLIDWLYRDSRSYLKAMEESQYQHNVTEDAIKKMEARIKRDREAQIVFTDNTKRVFTFLATHQDNDYTASDVANILGITTNSVTGSMNGLVKKGFGTRIEDFGTSKKYLKITNNGYKYYLDNFDPMYEFRGGPSNKVTEDVEYYHGHPTRNLVWLVYQERGNVIQKRNSLKAFIPIIESLKRNNSPFRLYESNPDGSRGKIIQSNTNHDMVSAMKPELNEDFVSKALTEAVTITITSIADLLIESISNGATLEDIETGLRTMKEELNY